MPEYKVKAAVMEQDAIDRALRRMGYEILERCGGVSSLVLFGIVRRGLTIARRLAKNIGAAEGVEVPVYELDVRPYRDDLAPGTRGRPAKDGLPKVTGCTAVLVDDVIFTGRTARAAMDALIDLGRPALVQLAVLVDRGHRELPVRPDYVGKNIPTSYAERVAVRLLETDGRDEVQILERA